MKTTEIIYENEEIIVINKAAGVSVQGGAGIAHPLDEELSKQMGYKIYLVHRLDKETSGLMIVAKTPQAASKWIRMIGGKLVKKEYTAVCFGVPSVKGKVSIQGTLTDSVKKAGRELSAVTNFKVEKQGKTMSVLHLTLGTGRMHQIRIHLAKAGAPIVQDDKHGNFKMNKIIRKAGIKTLCLAATKLSVPLNGKTAVFEIPFPEHIKKAVENLDWQNTADGENVQVNDNQK